MLKEKTYQRIQKITESVYLDYIGLIIVIFGSIYLGFHKTIKPLNLFGFEIQNYYLGYQSILSTSISVMVTRLVTRRKNIGNLIGTFNTVSVAMIEFMLGNTAAIITYPVSVIGNYYAYYLWKQKSEVVPIGINKWFFINFLFGFFISIVLNFIGFTNFLTTPNFEIQNMPLFITTTLLVGLTFGGQINTAKKYKENWFTWQLYNLTKFVQNLQLGNIAQLLKYVFYFFNATLGWITWSYVKKKKEEKF